MYKCTKLLVFLSLKKIFAKNIEKRRIAEYPMETKIYEEIHQLLLYQQIFMEDHDFLHYKEYDEEIMESYRVQFLEVQDRINELSQKLHKANERATHQILYTNKIRQTYTTDARRSQDMKDYVMVTVNPRLDVTHTELMSKVRQFMSLIVVECGYYNIEQRGEDSHQYIGFHSHFVFKRAKRPSEVYKELHRIFDDIVGNPQMHIKVKSVDKAEDAVNYIKYMLGHKKDPEKLLKVNNDKYMRQDFGYDDIYIVGRTPPTCWVSASLPVCV